MPPLFSLPRVVQGYNYLYAWTQSRDMANQLWVMSAGNKRELVCSYKNSVTPQMFAELNARSKHPSADSYSKRINISRLVMSGLMNLISQSVPGKQAFLFAPSCYLCCPCSDQDIIPEGKAAALAANVWKTSVRVAAWKSVRWTWSRQSAFLLLVCLFCQLLAPL
jgi:hypothetical protein